MIALVDWSVVVRSANQRFVRGANNDYVKIRPG